MYVRYNPRHYPGEVPTVHQAPWSKEHKASFAREEKMQHGSDNNKTQATDVLKPTAKLCR